MVKKKEVKAYLDEESGSFCERSLDNAIAALFVTSTTRLPRKNTVTSIRSSCDQSGRLLYVVADISQIFDIGGVTTLMKSFFIIQSRAAS